MEINRHNYEAYLLDQLEGRLSVEDQRHLHDFLQLNPDCAGELMELEPWILEGKEHSYQNKNLLRKELPNASSQLSESNFDLFCIARMEGDLSREQEDAHRAMLSAEGLKDQQWIEWQETKLNSEEVLFKGKDKLKHKSGPRNRMIWISAISSAAAVALLFTLFRTGPDLPEAEQAMEISTETAGIPHQMDVPVQTEVREEVQEEIQEEVQATQSSTEQPVKRTHNSLMFSVKKEHERPVESGPPKAVIPQEALKAVLLAGSAELINASSPMEEAVPDRIETLHIPPAQVHLSSLTVGQIYDMDFQEVVENYAQKKDFSLFTIASAGIKGINKLVGSDISLMASRDDEGEVSGIRLSGKRFSFSKPLGQEE